MKTLAKIVAADPTLRLDRNQETHQTVLWCMGEAHADVVLSRLRSGGAEVDTEPVQVAMRETIAKPARVTGRHVKQSGGHGQYAVCHVEFEPLPRGEGFVFESKVVGGSVPTQYIPSVEKGLRAQLERGLSDAKHPAVDLKATLVDGKAHSVDSSDAAFQTAGALALREAAAACGVVLLEPIDEIEVRIPDDYLGAVLGDLSGRRGRVLGTEVAGPGRTMVRAEVPSVQLIRYAVDLRAMTSGAAAFTRKFARYEEAPQGRCTVGARTVGGHPRHRARHHPEHEVVRGALGVPVDAAREAVRGEEHALHVAAAARAVRLGAQLQPGGAGHPGLGAQQHPGARLDLLDPPPVPRHARLDALRTGAAGADPAEQAVQPAAQRPGAGHGVPAGVAAQPGDHVPQHGGGRGDVLDVLADDRRRGVECPARRLRVGRGPTGRRACGRLAPAHELVLHRLQQRPHEVPVDRQHGAQRPRGEPRRGHRQRHQHRPGQARGHGAARHELAERQHVRAADVEDAVDRRAGGPGRR